MKNEWKTVSSRQAYANPFFSVLEDEIVHEGGNKQTYYSVVNTDAVYAVPFDGEKLLMVNQYRHPVGRRVWSFPAGHCESSDFLENAKKELKEETGYTAGIWTLLGEFASNSSLSCSKMRVYLAEDLSAGSHSREAGEVDMQTAFFTIAEIEELMAKEIFAGTTVAAFYFFKKHMESRNK